MFIQILHFAHHTWAHLDVIMTIGVVIEYGGGLTARTPGNRASKDRLTVVH